MTTGDSGTAVTNSAFAASGANLIQTNLGSVKYTNGATEFIDDPFGLGTRYFTKRYQSKIFTLVAEVDSTVTYFKIDHNFNSAPTCTYSTADLIQNDQNALTYYEVQCQLGPTLTQTNHIIIVPKAATNSRIFTLVGNTASDTLTFQAEFLFYIFYMSVRP
jgi:hypothetical protein